MKFARLEVLENGIPKKQDEDSAPLPLSQRVEKGQFMITELSFDRGDRGIPPSFAVFAKEPCPYVALVHGEDQIAYVNVWNMETRQRVAHINTGSFDCLITHQYFVDACVTKFSLTPYQFSYVRLPDKEDAGDLEFYTWVLDLDENKGQVVEQTRQDKKCLIIGLELESQEEPEELVFNIFATGPATNVIKVEGSNWLVVVETQNGQPVITKRVSLPDVPSNVPKLKDFKGDKFLVHYISRHNIYNTKGTKISFFDLTQERVIEDYHIRDLCELTQQSCCETESSDDNAVHEHCPYDSRFDFFSSKFILVKDYLSGFVIYDYREKVPRILSKGNMFCHLNPRGRFKFAHGMLFMASQKEHEMSPLTADSAQRNIEDEEDLEVIAVNLEKRSVQSLQSFGWDKDENSKLLLNEAHRSITCKEMIYSIVLPSLTPITETSWVLKSSKSSVIRFDFGLTSEEIANHEADAMYQEQLKKEENLKAEAKKRKEQRRQKEAKNKIVAKYKSGSDDIVKGPIVTWNRSWGFMRPTGEAKVLGNVFVHLTNLRQNADNSRPFLKKGVWIRCQVTKDEGRNNFKAVDITLDIQNANNGGGGGHRNRKRPQQRNKKQN